MAPQYAKDQPAGFTNRIERIAIVGVGGHVGRYVVEELLKTGKHQVTALMRAESKSEAPAGVARKDIDYASYPSLVAALQGQQVLIITMAVTAPPQQQADLIKAAAEAGVTWIMPNHWGGDMYHPGLSKDMMHGDAARLAGEKIEAEGKSWIAPTSSFWYEWSLTAGTNCFGIDIQRRHATLYDDGRTKINSSTWQQCGRAVAALFSLPELPQDGSDKSVTLDSFRNKPVYFDSFLVSQRDMLESVMRVTGTSEKDWTITENPLPAYYHNAVDEMKGGDRWAFARAMYSRAFFKNGGGDYSAKLDNDRLGLRGEDLDEASKRGVQWLEDGKVTWHQH